MAKGDFVFKREWYDKLIRLESEEERYKAAWAIIVSGITGEKSTDGDTFEDFWLETVLDRQNFSKAVYESASYGGQKGGKQKSYDDDELQKLVDEGWTAATIAQKLGISKSTVDHSDIWKNRKVKRGRKS